MRVVVRRESLVAARPIDIAEDAPYPIRGTVAPGFEPVIDEFRRNLAQRNELGGAVAVYRGDEPLVDLWGGWKDAEHREPWQRDTMVLVFSTTKGMAAVAIAHAMSAGLFSAEDLVADHWPEFAAHGKGDVTVGMLLAHQAGVPVSDTRFTPELIADPERLGAVLAAQRPRWRPGGRHGYHGLNLGFYESELIRRTDPAGRTLGRYFAEEVAGRLGASFHIGLPDEVPADRVAPIDGFHPLEMMLHLTTMPAGMVLAYMWPRSTTARAFSNPKVRRPADFDGPAWRRVEFPSGGGIGEVRAIAAIYGAMATGGEELGISRAAREHLEVAYPGPADGVRDVVLKVDTRYAGGFIKPPSFVFGSDDRAYGTMGAGGSFGFADPATGVGFAYAANRMGFHLWDDPREKALRDVVFRCL
jgi:CubicO group peptidase (beta-lactamase class C family)